MACASLSARSRALTRKEQTRHEREVKAGEFSAVNPFLPYDPDLVVADISDTHVALLNKFNVIDHHLLIVTRCFKWLCRNKDFQNGSTAISCVHAPIFSYISQETEFALRE